MRLAIFTDEAESEQLGQVVVEAVIGEHDVQAPLETNKPFEDVMAVALIEA